MDNLPTSKPRLARQRTPWEERQMAILNPVQYVPRGEAHLDDESIRIRPMSELSSDSYDMDELTRQPRRRSTTSITTFEFMCEKEREAYLERKKVDKFARELIDRLLKLKRRLEGQETKEEEAVRELLEKCKNSALYLRVMSADSESGTYKLSPFKSNNGNPIRHFFSTISSKTSSKTSSGQPSNVPTPSVRGSSVAFIASGTPDSPIRNRRISLPLELDYHHDGHRRYSRISMASNCAVYRMPVDLAPQATVPEEEPISAEIFRVISDPANPELPSLTTCPKQTDRVRRLSSCGTPLRSRTYSRTSTKSGQENLREISEFDAKGRKTVKLHWGQGVDEIIGSEEFLPLHRCPKTGKNAVGEEESPIGKVREAGLEVRERAKKMLRNFRGLGRSCDVEKYSKSGRVEVVKIGPRLE